jgi:hypothetical protein
MGKLLKEWNRRWTQMHTDKTKENHGLNTAAQGLKLAA